MSLDDMIAAMLSRSAPGSGSNYGGMCERMAAQALIGYPCWRCEGLGFREIDPAELARWRVRIASAKRPDDRDELRALLSHESTCAACDGTGFLTGRVVQVPIDSVWTTVRCSKCRGCGETFPPTDESAERQDVCQRCAGAMYLVPLTVRSTGSSRSGRHPRHAVDVGSGADDWSGPSGHTGELSEWVDETRLLEFGRASSALADLKRTNEAAAAALEAYCGPNGDRWGKHRWGRLFALWPLTKPGKDLVAIGMARSPADVRHLLDPFQVLASEREAYERDYGNRSNEERRRYVGRADRAARELWAHAQQVARELAA